MMETQGIAAKEDGDSVQHTGAQWIVKSLKDNGVNMVFGYPGGQIMPLYDALYDGGLEHILCRHEQGAAMAAIGYARSTGQTGVCIATSGPGATNLLTGLADAYIDSVPIVAITGQVPRALIGTDAFQEVDILGMSFACTKHSFLVDSVEALPSILMQAFAIASSGRPGPVLIDVPKDIQLASADFGQYLERFMHQEKSDACCNNETENHSSHVNSQSASTSHSPLSLETQNALHQANIMIANAQKPILYIGGGVAMSNAVNEVRNYIASTHIPTVATLKGLGAADCDDPYYLGLIGMHGFKSANQAVQECDLLIAAGVRFDDRVTGNINEFARNAKIIHIDIDPAELGKLKQPHVAIADDLKSIFPHLSRHQTDETWLVNVTKLKKQHKPSYQHPAQGIYAPKLLNQLSQTLSDDNSRQSVVTTDVGQHQMWTAQHMQFTHPNNFISSCGLGTMGFGLPAAIGAQLARPKDRVICVSGDGSFMMNIQELATIKRKQLPVKIVLLNNSRLGMVRQWQQLFFNQRYSETDLSDNPDFLMIANAFDIPGLTISHKNDVSMGIAQLMQSEGPFLLHVVIDAMENVWPLVPPGAANDNMLDCVQE